MGSICNSLGFHASRNTTFHRAPSCLNPADNTLLQLLHGGVAWNCRSQNESLRECLQERETR